MEKREKKSVAIIVAHPDEETLWAGGTILSHPEWNFFVVCLSNAKNPELAPRFYNALKLLKAEGVMGNFNYTASTARSHKNELERTIIQLLPDTHFDVIISHNSFSENAGDCTQEVVNESIIKLWKEGFISTDELWTSAYENGNIKYYPNSNAEEEPEVLEKLSKKVWSQKYKIITKIFGFDEKSREAKETPLTEAFWKYKNSINAHEKRSGSFGYGLNIFRSPNIEALKFLYHKSIEYVYDHDYWKFDDINENAEIIGFSENESRYSYKRIGKELNIFKSASIENLKSLYYKSISFLFDRNSWKTDPNYSDFSFNESEFRSDRKRRRIKTGNELRIFKAPNIESLKTMYTRSLSFVFERNKFEPDFAVCVDESNSRKKTLNIFENITIDSLKKKYNSQKD